MFCLEKPTLSVNIQQRPILVPMRKLLFWRKMFYSNNTVLNVLARSCIDNAIAVADIYKVTLFDLMYLDSSCLKKLFWNYFADTVTA